MRRRLARACAVVAATLALTGPALAAPAHAAATFSITPITWNVIGLDSNKPATGPNLFPVGERVCDTGSVTASGVHAQLAWTAGSAGITLTSPASLPVPDLTPGACADVYWQVAITATKAQDGTARGFTVTVTDDAGSTATSPAPRQLYVEHLVSQNRNGIDSITGPTTVYDGQTYTYTLTAHTATNGYEQLESFLNLDPGIFARTGTALTYTAPAGATGTTMHADACGWDNNPTSATYNSCIGPSSYGGKAGGKITQKVTVKVVGTGTQTLSALIYDFSGSSFHYNSDFGSTVSALPVTALPSADVSVTASAPALTQPGPLTVTGQAGDAGPDATTGPVTTTFTLPAGVTYTSVSGTGWSCTPAGVSVRCTHPALAVGELAPYRLTLAVSQAAPATVPVAVSVSGPDHDPATENNTASTRTSVDTTSGTLSGQVFSDTNADGTRQAGEPGLGGVTVAAYTDPTGTGRYTQQAATAVTAADGTFTFGLLAPGSYQVKVDQGTVPTGYSATSANPITARVSSQATTDLSFADAPGNVLGPGQGWSVAGMVLAGVVALAHSRRAGAAPAGR